MPPLRMSSGGGVATARMMAGLLCGTTEGKFRPLYRGRFLGSLATRYVGHSSSACKSLGNGGGQTNVERISQRSFGQIVVRLTMRVSQTSV